MRLRPYALWLAFSFALAPLAASAADGVLEINQDCALSTGCFPGDAPGYPVTIEGFDPGNPGAPIAPARSFRLTGDLGPLGPNDTAIVVNANNATIDLGGFRIFGVTSCSLVPVACSPTGSGAGVFGGSDVTVKNGTIHGMGGDGVRSFWSARVEGVNLFHNGGYGIRLDNSAIVRGNVITSNGLDGVRCLLNCAIHQNTVTGNGGDGIDAISGSVTGNSSSGNGERGGLFGPNLAFANNQFTGNAPPDVTNGSASGGNVCFDKSCSRRGARRFYLTQGKFSGNAVTSACDVGFHMASLFEIQDLGEIEYDAQRGYQPLGQDAGSGPPTTEMISSIVFGAWGWARTGGLNSNNASGVGIDNCLSWLTTSGEGTQITLGSAVQTGFATGQPTIAPWIAQDASCAVPQRVWCVED